MLRYLENSGCVGMCVNMCKIPTQDFFTNEFGLPLTMMPSMSPHSRAAQIVICHSFWTNNHIYMITHTHRHIYKVSTNSAYCLFVYPQILRI